MLNLKRFFYDKTDLLKSAAISKMTNNELKIRKQIYTRQNYINILRYSNSAIPVVYINQCLGAAHFKRWSIYAFYCFFVEKTEKRKKER